MARDELVIMGETMVRSEGTVIDGTMVWSVGTIMGGIVERDEGTIMGGTMLSYSHTVTFRGLRFTTFPSPTFCPKFVRFCRLLGFSTFIATFCDVLLRIATYCPVIQRLRAKVSLGIGTFSHVFTTCRYVFLRFSRFYQVITT